MALDIIKRGRPATGLQYERENTSNYDGHSLMEAPRGVFSSTAEQPTDPRQIVVYIKSRKEAKRLRNIVRRCNQD